MNRFVFTVLQLIFLIDCSRQSRVRQAVTTVKAIGKTIKTPIIKNSVSMLRRNKNTIKNLACGFQEKYLKISHNFGSKSVKYLGEEAIKKFKYTAPQAAKGGNHLIRAESKKNIWMRSAEQIRRKELSSLISMVSKSKPQLPFLVGGGLYSLNEFNLVPDDQKFPHLAGKKPKPGKFTLPDGKVYEGDLFDGNVMHGKGKLTFKNGNTYEGDFKDNQMHGKGKLTEAAGNIYEGDFKKGKMEGKGKMVYSDNMLYTGSYVNDKRHGYGECFLDDGSYYKGNWKENMYDGEGELLDVGYDTTTKGIWANDMLVSGKVE